LCADALDGAPPRALRGADVAVRRRLDRFFSTPRAEALVDAIVRLWAGAVARRHEPSDALRALLALHDELFRRIDVLAVELDGGVHAKHRIMRYHDFFVDRVHEGESVLDVGCGKAELAHDLVE